MNVVNSTTLSNLEKMLFPAVFALENSETKTVWISRTNCLAEALLRTIKNVKSGDHKIKSLGGWEPLCLYSGKELLYNYSRLCREYKEKGWTLLNRTIQYRIMKKFKRQENGKYLSLVVLGTRNYDLKTLGEFKTAAEANEFIKTWRATNSI